jgi:hypothetical protein
MSAGHEPLPSLMPEPVVAFLRRPGAAPSLAKVLLPEQGMVELAGLGTAGLRFRCLDHDGLGGLVADAKATSEVFALPSMGPGLLLVDRWLARHVVNGLLGLPMPRALVALSRIERGILGGIVASALGKLGLSFAICLDQAHGNALAGDAIALAVTAELGGASGQVWLCASPASLGGCWETSSRRSGIPTAVLRIELARTRLPEADVSGATIDDVVVFEETAALASSSSWAVQLRYHGRRAEATLNPDGRVRGESRTGPTARMTRGRMPPTDSHEVEIAAELARAVPCTNARPQEDLVTSPRGDGVLLRVGESDWAEGALCEHSGRLAVRITRKLAD